MVILRAIKPLGWPDFSHNRLFMLLLGLFLRDERGSHLLGGMVEDYGPILAAHVGSLTVKLCWVMNLPEQIEQLFITDHEGIVFHEHHFGVARAIATNVLIGGALAKATAVADGGGEDA